MNFKEDKEETEKQIQSIRDRLNLEKNPLSQEEATKERFFQWYMTNGPMNSTYWMGIKVLKIPFDLWNYQEIIYGINPDVIIETGTYLGGSALFMANCLDHLGRGKVLTIDIIKKSYPSHPRITYLQGDVLSPETIQSVDKFLLDNQAKVVMVILDSEHTTEHVDRELELYAPFVTHNSYLIVEDTCLYGGSTCEGPRFSVNKFLSKHKEDYFIDTNQHKFGITLNPCSYLVKRTPRTRITFGITDPRILSLTENGLSGINKVAEV